MGLLDDIASAAARFNQWLESSARALTEWAGSEPGQNVLLGLDFLALTTRIGEFYSRVGWYLPVHPLLHRYALEHVVLHAPFDPRRTTELVAPGSTHWDWIVEGLRASPSLQTRQQVLDDGIFCIENERWHAAVSTLLPLIEGLVSEYVGIFEGMRVDRRLDELLESQQLNNLEALSAVPALSVLESEIFVRTDFAKMAVSDTALNRHLVLHGRTAGFGSRMHACRTLMFVIAVAELLDGAILLRTAQAPADTASFLDDYGPLAPLRQAGLRSRVA